MTSGGPHWNSFPPIKYVPDLIGHAFNIQGNTMFARYDKLFTGQPLSAVFLDGPVRRFYGGTESWNPDKG